MVPPAEECNVNVNPCIRRDDNPMECSGSMTKVKFAKFVHLSKTGKSCAMINRTFVLFSKHICIIPNIL